MQTSIISRHLLRLHLLHLRLLLLLLLLHLLLTSATHPTTINPTLHNQALSHLSFHSNPLKLALASLFTPRTLAIAGVEWGEDLILFASHNYHVIAFEPATKYITHINSLLSKNPSWNVTFHPIAAANQTRPAITLRYPNDLIHETVPAARVDDLLSEQLAVFSLDVQGEELYILQGSQALLKNHRVSSLWIEAIACNQNVQSILHMLHPQYVFFDFVPWGRPFHHPHNVPRSTDSFAYHPERPSHFPDFLNWMCQLKKHRYQWLQTDFLAVRRDLLTHTIWKSLSTLAESTCHLQHADCLLRSLLPQFTNILSSAKEEL